MEAGTDGGVKRRKGKGRRRRRERRKKERRANGMTWELLTVLYKLR